MARIARIMALMAAWRDRAALWLAVSKWRPLAATFAAGLLLGLLLGCAPARAHNAPSGWTYDYPECCLGTECQQVADGLVRQVQGGFQISIPPGGHLHWHSHRTAPLEAFIPFGDPRIRSSGDQHRHVCIVLGRVGCVYIPPGGV